MKTVFSDTPHASAISATRTASKPRYVGQPFPGWDGIVRCEVLAVDEPRLLRYDWRNKESDEPTVVTNRLEQVPGGTRLTWDHTGFRGIEGVFMAGLLGRVRGKMLSEGLPAVLNDLDDQGHLRPESRLHPWMTPWTGGSSHPARPRDPAPPG